MATLRPDLEQAILDILVSKWPLRVNCIVQDLKKHGFQISYANARKKIFKLAHEGVLKRDKDGFSLSLEWFAYVKAFAERVLENYEGRPTRESLANIESTAEFWFGSVRELDKFFVTFTDVRVDGISKDIPVCWQIKHSWWPLFYSQAEHEVPGGVKRFYILCEGETPIDEWCCDAQRKMGYNVRHGSNSSNCDTAVFGDLIFQIYLPADFTSSLENLLGTTIDRLDMNSLLELVSQPRRIRVAVMKNAELADVLRSGILKHF